MAKYKLYYFDVPGRGEVSRLLFTLAGQEFEDHRFTGEEWQKEKASGRYPLGQVPILEIGDNITLCQSQAIERYIANEFNLGGSTNLEKALVDNIVATIRECGQAIVDFHWMEQDETRKAQKKEKAFTEIIPKRLAYLENALKSNDGGKGWFVGSSTSYADLVLFQSSQILKMVGGGDLLDKVPALQDLIARIASHPKLADYFAKQKK